jgi:hypothetical protein
MADLTDQRRQQLYVTKHSRNGLHMVKTMDGSFGKVPAGKTYPISRSGVVQVKITHFC